MRAVWSFIEKNRGVMVALLVSALVAWAVVACRAKTVSPISGEEVTQPQLEQEYAGYLRAKQAEVEEMTAAVELSREELAQKQALIDDLVQLGNDALSVIPGPWGPVGLAAFGLLTGGGLYDKQRRGRVIDKFKGALQEAGVAVPQVNP